MSLHKPIRALRHAWPLALCALLAACTPAANPTIITPTPVVALAPLPTTGPARVAKSGDCPARGAFPPLLSGLRYGVNAFLFGADQRRVLALAQQAGFGWLRQQIHWRDIETRPGGYDWGALDLAVETARGQGVRLLLSVVRSPRWTTASGAGGLPDDPAAIGSFMRALSARYAGRVSAYEIWNEPNLAAENGGRAATPAQYLATLQAAYAAVKQADPCAIVLAAPLASTATDDPAVAADDLRFYRALYKLDGGAFLHAADAIALHPGGGDHPTDAHWPDDTPAQSRFYFRHIEEIRALMEQAGDRRQAWITEVGWAVQRVPGGPPLVSAEQQADNLVGALRFTRAAYPWVAAIFVWNLNFAVLGPAGDEKSAFGILNADWSPRPAYLALQAFLEAQATIERKSIPRFSDGAPYQQSWQIAAAGKIHTPATLDAAGTVYIGSDKGRFYAISPAGGLRWVFDAGSATRDAPAVGANGTIYLGDDGGHLTALRPDGAPIWRRSLGSALRGAPQLDGDALYVVTAGGQALRLDLAGQVIWRTSLGAPAAPALLGRPGDAAPALLYVPTAAGEVLALTTDGAVRWRTALGSRIISAPALAAQRGDGEAQLLVGEGQGYLNSLDAGSGRLRWRRKLVERVESPTLPLTSALISAPPLVAADGTIYLGGRDGGVTALDPAGNLRWHYDSGSDISASPAEDPDGTIYVALYDKRLLALDRAGRLRWQVKVNGAVRSTPLRGPDGTLYIGTLGARLYALAPANKGSGSGAE
jgi:outer membrane protein assembly factor BamB